MAKSIAELIQRRFTKELENEPGKTVYDLFNWTKRNVCIKDRKSGRVLTEMKDVLFPDFYSQNAADIIVSKYFRKAGVPETGYETSLAQLVHRMADFWVAALIDEGMIDEEKGRILYDELAFMMLSQRFAPNSPQWFNTGLKRAYGLGGGCSELYYYDEKAGAVKMSPDDYTRTQASACFILSVEDKLLGPHSISETFVTETKLFKGGSGTGSNFSAVRALGEKLSGGGVSSGLMSFLRGLDRNAGAIKSGGTTRRAAKMVCLDIDHPDIESFVLWKSKEEDKALALMKMGYDGDIDGEAYNTVSGQNSNNSVRISDEFMRMVSELDRNPEATLELKGRVDPSVNRQIPVARLWEEFNQAAWRCADPAPQFSDTFNAWHTCPAGEDGEAFAAHNRLNSTNPCGEYAFLDDTSCNLASLNLYAFYDAKEKAFMLDDFVHAVSLAQLVLEASIVWGQFPTEDIARRTWMFRTTGLGFANLASLLMVRGLPYDSDEARAYAAALTAVLTGQSYAVSALMAKETGPFAKYDLNKPYMQRVIRNHARVAGALEDRLEGLNYEPLMLNHDILKTLGEEALSRKAKEVWLDALELGRAYGFRNAQVSVMAPTGTIAFAMDCGATGIEPFFSHISYKKLVGGGFMIIANPVIAEALENLGYSREEAEAITRYVDRKDEHGLVRDGKLEGAPYLKEEHLPIFDTANVCGSGERFIRPAGHVLMVAAITPLVSGAISKTVNLPNRATIEDFKEVHLLAWRMGVKGITLYRDGSKNAQPLNNTYHAADGTVKLEDLNYPDLLAYAKTLKQELSAREGQPSRRSKLSGIRCGRTHPAQIDGIKIYTTVNRTEDGRISEIYITTDREGTTIMGLLNSLSKTISVMLQYHIPAASISKMLRGQKYEPYGFVQRHPHIKYVTSISDLISKIIDIELGDYSRVQVKPAAYIAEAAEAAEAETAAEPDREEALRQDTINRLAAEKTQALREAEGERFEPSDPYTQGFIHESAREAALHGQRLYDGSVCPTCSGTRMVQNGTCKVCLDCGTTTGCG